MGSLALLPNAYSPRFFYASSAPSSAITNTTTETAFDQFLTFPSAPQRYVQPITSLTISANGVISTGLLNLGLTLRVRWGGILGTVVCNTGSFNLSSSLSNAGWSADATFLITGVGASGSIEVQGFGSFSSGLLTVNAIQMANTSADTIDTTINNDVVFTAQWGTQTPNNSIQIRTMLAEINGQ